MGIAHSQVKKVARITVGNLKFYSSSYSRMQRRTCSVVLYGGEKIGSITHFLMSVPENKVFAVINCYEKMHESSLTKFQGGKHMICVKSTVTVDVVPADELDDTLVFIRTAERDENFVVKMPNHHGHAVFK